MGTGTGVEAWLRERFGDGAIYDEESGVWISATVLYALYRKRRRDYVSQTMFGRELNRLGLRKKRKRKGFYYLVPSKNLVV